MFIKCYKIYPKKVSELVNAITRLQRTCKRKRRPIQPFSHFSSLAETPAKPPGPSQNPIQIVESILLSEKQIEALQKGGRAAAKEDNPLEEGFYRDRINEKLSLQ